MHHFAFNSVQRLQFLHILVNILKNNSYPHRCDLTSPLILICISMGNDVEPRFIYLLDICVFFFFWKKCLLMSFSHF
jgi:predicted AlkP superfamily pyrophosphatase or phosphodiesterase